MRALLAPLLLAGMATAAEAQPDPTPRRPVETVPANGVDEAPRRGTFVESSLGFFTTFGGSAGASAGQPYLAITVGREIGERAALFVSLGIGASAASCFSTSAAGDCVAADSFGATFVELGGSYGVALALRTLLSLKLVVGATDLSPGPVRIYAPEVAAGSRIPDHLLGFHVGGGLSLDYDTHLDHFAVGLDALVRQTLSGYTAPAADCSAGQSTCSKTLSLTSLAVMPRIRYVF